ncbi:Coatomer subunit zeta-2 [Picochlorum sp. SENEW3]|nr:hypothetical protein M9434_005380 [Picochlorum sp. BPE23]KAI8101527.1 hypothetical protein M9435_001631 [Picochlorum sp. BPE23]WPT11569.1 Coatomer subunit zeta-2 [Picochlorum sp. SENEW3]WPT17064.1 Coatomer subunit zeta-2 [Picochlorum sp. SENEW3]
MLEKKPLAVDPTVPTVNGLVLLDNEGKRVAVQYFGEKLMGDVSAQSEVEMSLYTKTVRTNARGEAEIIMLDDAVAVYRFVGDLMFFVLGDVDENEIILSDVLTGFCDSITLLLRNAVEKKTVLENLDLVLLAMDEISEGGLLLETDPAVIATRVTMRAGDDTGDSPMGMDNPGLQSLSAAFGNVKEQLARSLLK